MTERTWRHTPDGDYGLCQDGQVECVKHLPATYNRYAGAWGCDCGSPSCTGVRSHDAIVPHPPAPMTGAEFDAWILSQCGYIKV